MLTDTYAFLVEVDNLFWKWTYHAVIKYELFQMIVSRLLLNRDVMSVIGHVYLRTVK